MAKEQVVWFKARAILKKVTWSSWTTLWAMPLGDMIWGPPSWSWLVYTYQGHPRERVRRWYGCLVKNFRLFLVCRGAGADDRNKLKGCAPRGLGAC